MIAKRDSPRDAILQVGALTSARLGGVALTEAGAITGLAQGQFTVSSSVFVNEYNPAAELGEGIDFIAFEAGSNFAVANYTGTGAAQTVALPFRPKALLHAKLTGSVVTTGRIKTDTMGSDEAKVVSNGAALQSAGMTFVAGGLQLTAASPANTSGDTFVVIAFRDHTEDAIGAPAVKRRRPDPFFCRDARQDRTSIAALTTALSSTAQSHWSGWAVSSLSAVQRRCLSSGEAAQRPIRPAPAHSRFMPTVSSGLRGTGLVRRFALVVATGLTYPRHLSASGRVGARVCCWSLASSPISWQRTMVPVAGTSTRTAG